MRLPLNLQMDRMVCATCICGHVYVEKWLNKFQITFIKYFFITDIPSIRVRMLSPECPTI